MTHHKNHQDFFSFGMKNLSILVGKFINELGIKKILPGFHIVFCGF